MTAFTQAYNSAHSKEGLMRLQSDGIDTIRTRAGALCGALVLAVAAMAQPARAQGWNPPPPEKRCPSQWGANDERGAANLQTPQAVLKATRMIREGKVYELGKVLEPSIPRSGARPYSLKLARTSGPTGRITQRRNEAAVF